MLVVSDLTFAKPAQSATFPHLQSCISIHPQAPVLRRGPSLASLDPAAVGESPMTLASAGDALAAGGSRSDVSKWSGGVRAGSGSLVTEDSIHVRIRSGCEYPRRPSAERRGLRSCRSP